MSYDEKENGRAGGIGAPASEGLGQSCFDGSSDSSQSAANVPPFKPDELAAYAGCGLDLIRLNVPTACDARGRSVGKAPRDKGWRDAQPMTLDEASAHMGEGSNVGVRLRSDDLVVDVDPRNFEVGDDPLARLSIDLGVDWTDFPTVITGSGGKHIYMRKPDAAELVNELQGYRGVEFKSAGRQVVAAGSVHPETRRPYLWDDDFLAVPLKSRPMAPDSLIQLAQRPTTTSRVSEAGEFSAEQLEVMLTGLSVLDYREQSRWLELMMACHHATAGDGRDVFIAWSIADPTYQDHAQVIGNRWDSLRADSNGRRVSVATLIKSLIDAGHGDLIPRDSAQDDFPDDLADAAVAAAKPRTRQGVADEWVYVIDAEMFIRRSDGKKWKKEQWKARYAGLREGDIVNAVFKGQFPVRKFEALEYLPCESEFPDGEDGGRYNIWHPSGVEAKPGDVQPFIDHMAYLFADEVERGHALDYLAMLVQRPDQKVNFALLVKGGQGTGKSWIGRLITAIIGRRNVVLPSNSEVMSQWTAWTEGAQLGIVEELMAPGRFDMANRLKPIITEPYLRIESKGCSLYSIPNKLNLLAFTNHDDAVPIERGDRRWLVLFSDAKPLDEAYYERLFQYLDGEGPAAVKHWLMQRQIGLNPKGMAPKTVGKDQMRRLSMGDAEQFLTELMEEGAAPFDFPLVRFDEVLAAVPADVARRSPGLRNRVTKWITGEAAAVKHERYKKQDGSGRQNCHLWSTRDHAYWSDLGAAARIDAYLAHRKTDDRFAE